MGGCVHTEEVLCLKLIENKMHLFTVCIYSFSHVFIGSAHVTAKVWREKDES